MWVALGCFRCQEGFCHPSTLHRCTAIAAPGTTLGLTVSISLNLAGSPPAPLPLAGLPGDAERALQCAWQL